LSFDRLKFVCHHRGKILAFLACGYLFVSQSILGFRKKGPDEKLSEFSALSSWLTVKKPIVKSKKVMCIAAPSSGYPLSTLHAPVVQL